MIFPTAVMRSAQSLIELAKKASPRRCETCKFWGGAAGLLSARGWKRCKLENKDTSPVYVCGKYEQE